MIGAVNPASASETPETTPVEVVNIPEMPPVEPSVSIREKMFGDKVKKPEVSPVEPKKDEPSVPQKKGARERIQEVARERNAEREARMKAESETKRLQDELKELKSMNEEEKSQRDIFKEIHLEDKIREQYEKNFSDLTNYRESLDDGVRESFDMNYDYYVPALNRYDRESLEIIWSYPQRFEMLDFLMKTINSGQFSLQEWVNAPMPMKYEKIKTLAEFVLNPQQSVAPVPKKEVPDSIVPNLKSKSEVEVDAVERGSTFKKVFERGVGRR
jgi:hypothetical protein